MQNVASGESGLNACTTEVTDRVQMCVQVSLSSGQYLSSPLLSCKSNVFICLSVDYHLPNVQQECDEL